MTTVIEVENLKCGGCANTIRKSLNAIAGVKALDVDTDSGEISLEIEKETLLKRVRKKLRELGYPEKGTLKGLNGMAAAAKSYMSCMIGKLNK